MTSPSDEGTVAAEQTAPEQRGAVEQSKSSFEDQLIQLAREDGHIGPQQAGDQLKAEQPEVPGELEEADVPTTPSEGEDAKEPEEENEEQQPAAEKDKLDKLVPLREVIEERGKKQRANERAERVEAELAKALQERDDARRQLAQAGSPMPTPQSPLIDVQDPIVLDRLERVYELLEEVDLDNVNEDGTVTVPSAIGQDGRIVYAKIDPDQARLAQKRADRVLRKDIPSRREYLAQRDQIDAQATELYPDLKNPDHQFTQLVNQLTQKVLSGQAMTSPEVKFWVANGVYGLMKRREEGQAANGNGASNGVKKILESSKQKIAPTAPRTRATVERRSSADLAKTEQAFEKNPTPENALAYTEAILSGKQARKTVQPVAE